MCVVLCVFVCVCVCVCRCDLLLTYYSHQLLLFSVCSLSHTLSLSRSHTPPQTHTHTLSLALFSLSHEYTHSVPQVLVLASMRLTNFLSICQNASHFVIFSVSRHLSTHTHTQTTHTSQLQPHPAFEILWGSVCETANFLSLLSSDSSFREHRSKRKTKKRRTKKKCDIISHATALTKHWTIGYSKADLPPQKTISKSTSTLPWLA